MRGSGLVLIHYPELFVLLDTWLGELSEISFRKVVPLLRRAFAEFSRPKRRQLMKLTDTGPAAAPTTAEELDFDWARGVRVLPMLRKLLGAAAA